MTIMGVLLWPVQGRVLSCGGRSPVRVGLAEERRFTVQTEAIGRADVNGAMGISSPFIWATNRSVH